jgi:Raf kinase inhibitor-like YbhB/YbcL family protein
MVLFAQGVCGAEIISPAQLTITDVTPVSFSVVWTTSEPATCSLNVFVDAQGTTPYDEAEILSESSRHPPAEDIGVMKLRVLGLKPGSQYFFQTKTTFKRNGTVSLYPEGPPFIEVKTETSSIVVFNDVLTQQIIVGGGRLTLGTILIAQLDSASYPISGWAGEGVPDNWAAIDANNFYDKETRLNLELEGGEVLKLTVLGGDSCYVETQDTVPKENGGFQLLEVAATLPDSMCKNLRPNLLPVVYILLLLLDNNEEPFTLASDSFSHGEPIPAEHSLGGGNFSPPLSWHNAPENVESFVLIMDDPDAPEGTWDHWIVYDIPAGTASLPANAGASGGSNLPQGAKHGINSWSNNYYQGPSLPSGTHRYYFKLYALSVSELNPSGLTRADIEAAMSDKILGQADLMGTYTYSPLP